MVTSFGTTLVVASLASSDANNGTESACLQALREHTLFTSGLATIPCRDDLARAAQHHFLKTGNACEIGVFRGEFAAKMAVDAWAYRPSDDLLDKNYVDNVVNQQNKMAAWTRMLKSANGDVRRITQIQALSHQAADMFNASQFDWVYIDALHTYEAVRNDLRAWWPKLRTGGLLSGDDYGDVVDTEYVTRERYEHMLKGSISGRVPYTYRWGVIRALQQFARETGSTLHTTWSLDCYGWPAWYLIKPPDCVSTSAQLRALQNRGTRPPEKRSAGEGMRKWVG